MQHPDKYFYRGLKFFRDNLVGPQFKQRLNFADKTCPDYKVDGRIQLFDLAGDLAGGDIVRNGNHCHPRLFYGGMLKYRNMGGVAIQDIFALFYFLSDCLRICLNYNIGNPCAYCCLGQVSAIQAVADDNEMIQ